MNLTQKPQQPEAENARAVAGNSYIRPAIIFEVTALNYNASALFLHRLGDLTL